MEAPGAHRLLAAWESAAAAPPIWRPVALIAGTSDHPASDVARWPIGRRDGALMDLQQRWFGDAMECLADCPACGSTAEFSARLSQLAADAATTTDDALELSHDGWQVRFRLPDSHDLADVASHAVDPATARAQLLDSVCTEILDPSGTARTTEVLPESVIDPLEQRIAEADPLSEIAFELECPSCRHAWNVTWDPGDHLWRQLDHEAGALLRDIHRLASAHGWSEAEILALSPARRRAYLDLIGT